MKRECQLWILKIEFKKTTKIWHVYSLRFWSIAGTQRYKRGFVKKKKQGNKIKDLGEAYGHQLVYWCSHLNSICQEENFATLLFYLLSLELKHKV